MALKATIFKADISITDMDRNYYNDHNLTIARHPLVVGDGYGSYHNDGAARDAAQANGVTINGLAVDDPGYFIDACLPSGYYFENITTADGQCYQANSYADFEQALTLALIDATETPRLVAAPRPLAIFAFSFLLFTCIRSVLFRCLSVKYA